MRPQGGNLITHVDPKSPVAEAFRTLRTNLQYANAGNPVQKLLITSSTPGEGKSTITANLGHVLAQSGKKVIIVSVDLRKPSIHQYFQVPNRLGVTNILVGQASISDCLINIPLVENLQLLPSGPTPPNPAELLSSHQMELLINDLQKSADIILFDAPPVVAVTDAAVLAPKTDGVLLVINAGTVPRDLALNSKEQIERVGGRVLGVVLNRVDIKEGHGYYYYYYDSENGNR